MDDQVCNVRIYANSDYALNRAFCRIQVEIPISCNTHDSNVCNEIYRSWDEKGYLPEEFTSLNGFIDQVRKIANISTIMLGSSHTFGNYVGLIIVKASGIAGTIAQLEKLIYSCQGYDSSVSSNHR